MANAGLKMKQKNAGVLGRYNGNPVNACLPIPHLQSWRFELNYTLIIKMLPLFTNEEGANIIYTTLERKIENWFSKYYYYFRGSLSLRKIQ